MEQKIKTKVVGEYNGHSIKQNKNIDVSFKCKYDQLAEYIQLIQYLNVDTKIVVKLPDEEPFTIGTFRVKSVNVDHDGEGKVQFNSMTDFVELDGINRLVGTELIKILFTADVELPDTLEGEE